MTERQPAVFVSHGSPMTILEDSPARDFLKSLGDLLPRPEAILVVSAHWETEKPSVSLSEKPATIHDFRGFPEALYQLRYPAPGAPALAERTAALLEAAGFEVARDPDRGLDHGAWMPLLLGMPEADLPVTQLSIQPDRDPAYHAALGKALAPLRDEGVLILATGALTHNLRDLAWGEAKAPTPEWPRAFADWMAEKAEAGDREALLDYRARAPHAVHAHPSDEHLLPFYVALGAGSGGGGGGGKARALHRSFTYGTLAMDAYAFG